MYYEGQGVSQNYQEAFNWLMKAAAQGHADAQYNISLMYGKGQGVTQNRAEAIKWLRKAANQGHQKAKELIKKLQ